ncbi:sugar ABC transporter substrate-binding protein [Acidiphilium sp. C61]|uniref:ABC transporter substrate-binding protein n=1 Tax=Acidiphilium sp. C61 TaxID=1671485 RepID=UPI00157B3AF9|nr:sugar ABC transporter substrate-binding protein [Acidiphilium sp. C61]
MKRQIRTAMGGLALGCLGIAAAHATTLTIATVNNPDMLQMQKLSPQFTKETGIKLNWVVLPENTLRQRVTTDIATNSGNFDIVTVGSYEVPIWGKAGWLAPVKNLPANYDAKDLFPTVRKGLSYKGTLYALPFYAESSATYYRKDLFKAAGIAMPAHPTYTEIAKFAAKINDPSKGIYGMCLRGLPGWGENMAFFTTLVNTFGGRWFNMKWQPRIDSPAWKKAANFYVNLEKKYGPPNVTSNGFTENLALFSQGKCGMWIDSTVAAGTLWDPKTSKVANEVGMASAPVAVTPHGAHWLWAWALAMPKTTRHKAADMKFLEWATSKAYLKLVGNTFGWVQVPPGTRISTYSNPDYIKAAPFASKVKEAILSADPNNPTLKKVPYTGVQFVAIPQFEGIGTEVGQQLAAALAGQKSVDAALAQAQNATARTMKEAGYH